MGSPFATGRGPWARETETQGVVRGAGARVPKATRAEVSTVLLVWWVTQTLKFGLGARCSHVWMFEGASVPTGWARKYDASYVRDRKMKRARTNANTSEGRVGS